MVLRHAESPQSDEFGGVLDHNDWKYLNNEGSTSDQELMHVRADVRGIKNNK